MSTTTTTTTSTLIVNQQPSSVLLPASNFDGNSRVVRFDNECILIPETSKRPKALKTYSLPLWKKRSGDAESEASAVSPRGSLSPEETHVVFKLPIPRFISLSPTRGRTASASSPTKKPLSPCLVKRNPSTSPSPTLSKPLPKPLRRSSLPITTSTRQKDDAALTVPLRACCAGCESITEESLKEGEQWQEKFSRGARRRRSASLDNSDSFSRDGSWSTTSGHSSAFAALAANPLRADLGPVSNPRYRNSTFTITVDEIDKRRKSQEYTEEELKRFRTHSSSSSTPRVLHSPDSTSSYPLPHRDRATDKERSSSSSSASSFPTSSESLPLDIPPRRLKSSPIQEEDEDQLFPLPSPRRTPNTSPSPSLNASPAASPNASTTYLANIAAASKDSLLHVSNASSEVLAVPFSRKTSNGVKSTTAPQVSPNASIADNLPKAQPLIPVSPPAPSATSNTTKASPLSISVTSRPSTVPITIPSSPLSTSATISPTTERSRSPPSSPTVSTKTRRPSFSLPAIRDAIKGASADVLKGVSSMGGGGSIVGSV